MLLYYDKKKFKKWEKYYSVNHSVIEYQLPWQLIMTSIFSIVRIIMALSFFSVVSPLNLYSDWQTEDVDSTLQRIFFDFRERGFLFSLVGVSLFIRHVLANFGDSQLLDAIVTKHNAIRDMGTNFHRSSKIVGYANVL